MNLASRYEKIAVRKSTLDTDSRALRADLVTTLRVLGRRYTVVDRATLLDIGPTGFSPGLQRNSLGKLQNWKTLLEENAPGLPYKKK